MISASVPTLAISNLRSVTVSAFFFAICTAFSILSAVVASLSLNWFSQFLACTCSCVIRFWAVLASVCLSFAAFSCCSTMHSRFVCNTAIFSAASTSSRSTFWKFFSASSIFVSLSSTASLYSAEIRSSSTSMSWALLLESCSWVVVSSSFRFSAVFVFFASPSSVQRSLIVFLACASSVQRFWIFCFPSS